MFWAAGHEADVISIAQNCELEMPDLHSSSWNSGLQMVVQTINEDAEQSGTEWAALSEADGWALAWATLTSNSHRQQRAIIQGLDPACGHAPPAAAAGPRGDATEPCHRLM